MNKFYSMKKSFLFTLIIFSFSAYCQMPSYQEDSFVEEKNGINGDVFFDFSPSVCSVSYSIYCMFSSPNNSASSYFWYISTAVLSITFPSELVYYRKLNDEGVYKNYFGLSHAVEMIDALYFSDRFAAGVKCNALCDLCVGKASFKVGTSLSLSLLLAFEPFAVSTGLRAGYFDNDWYLAPLCELDFFLNDSIVFFAEYSDGSFFDKDIKRISTGFRFVVF